MFARTPIANRRELAWAAAALLTAGCASSPPPYVAAPRLPAYAADGSAADAESVAEFAARTCLRHNDNPAALHPALVGTGWIREYRPQPEGMDVSVWIMPHGDVGHTRVEHSYPHQIWACWIKLRGLAWPQRQALAAAMTRILGREPRATPTGGFEWSWHPRPWTRRRVTIEGREQDRQLIRGRELADTEISIDDRQLLVIHERGR